ncbi:hypothetical protein BDZ45DRAFT_683106 [Acephala macrosclerotiorum]|nr:hypothetical protein BDZ45DRAFT_683106 [Acephala macrosclerotiorum]
MALSCPKFCKWQQHPLVWPLCRHYFQVTITVPSLSRGFGAHGVWPGIQNSDDALVFQSVISDSRVPGIWQFFVEYCCNPDYQASLVRADFGQVQWTSLTITASTTSAWCNGAYTASGGFIYVVSGGASHTSSSSTTCDTTVHTRIDKSARLNMPSLQDMTMYFPAHYAENA